MPDPLRLRAEGVGWLAAWRLSRALPERFVVRAFERMGERSFARNAKRREGVIEALTPVVGPDLAQQTARDAFRWYGRYWAETFRMQDVSQAEFDRRWSVEGAEHIANAFAAGRGAVLVTPHFGNWDAGGRWATSNWPMTAVVEVLRPKMLFERFTAHRESLGLTIVPLERGADATAQCARKLEAGELVALVCDRDMSGTGVEVKMFGRTTKMPPGPAVLARRTGAPILPAVVYQNENGSWHAEILPALEPSDDVSVVTQRIADAFARLIGKAPAQWHMFSRYWIDQ